MMAVNYDLNSGQGQGCGNECFDIVKSSQTYTVPCTRHVREAYTVQVPKTKVFTINKQVPYIDYETKTKQVPYHYVDRQTVTRSVPTCRTVPMVKNVCTSVRSRRRGLGFGRQCYVKKKCPRTVMVTQRGCQQRRFCQSIPKIGWKSVQESVPVQRVRNKTELQYKTENVPERRYRTRTVTTMVNKTVPVYNVVKKPEPVTPQQDELVRTIPAPDEPTILPPLIVQSAPPVVYSNAATSSEAAVGAIGAVVETSAAGTTSYNSHSAVHQENGRAALIADFNRIDRTGDGQLSYGEVAFDTADANTDGVLDINEYHKGYGVQYGGNYKGVDEQVVNGYGSCNNWAEARIRKE